MRPPPGRPSLPAEGRRAAEARRYQTMLFRSYLVGALVSFGILMLVARRKTHFDLELRIARAIQRPEHPWFASFMHGISWPGYPPQANLLAALPAIALYRGGMKKEAAAVALSALGMSVVGLAVKLLIGRARPHAELLRVRRVLDGGKQSFPAGHVQIYVPVFGFLAFVSYTLIQRSWQRTLTLWASFAAIALVGPSRIYAGEHWPSDVLGGYLLGSLWLWLTVRLYRRAIAREPLRVDQRQ